ncbi:MAG: OsmC family protein [Rhodobacteraceae bacterium]|nr:OsmC family protein [Paracoccaceae bacterium]
MKRHASAVWKGDLQSGTGEMSSQSGAIKSLPFSFKTRFGDEPGTNPEELIGAAHAGCFSMAFSNELAKAGLNPESVETKATVTLDTSQGADITEVLLESTATVPGADEAKVREIGDAAKAGCPVSKVLNAAITLKLTVKT